MTIPKKPSSASVQSAQARPDDGAGPSAAARRALLAGVLPPPAAAGAGLRTDPPAAPNDHLTRLWVGAAWCCSAVLVAAGVAWALAAAMDSPTLWIAPLAAALATLAAVLPITVMAPRLQTAEPLLPDRSPLALALAGCGVPRPLFLELAGREWSRARRHGSGAALLVVGIDRAARLAQTRGGAAVDALMAALLRQTAPTLRSADLLTVYSPSEIAVFLAPADATGALDVAERIRERSEQLEVAEAPGGLPLRASISVGVAHLRPAHLNLQALMDDAEDAAAAARQAGGNCVRAAPIEPGTLRGPAAPPTAPARD